ncbi:MAG TPA: hypothetical protein PK304_01700 [Mobilitalea sp.]|nr:hypothetical protein [Mobilitalea sp.]
MKEKELIYKAIQSNMPNLEEVRQKCLSQNIPAYTEKKKYTFAGYIVFASLIFAVTITVFNIPVIKAWSKNLLDKVFKTYVIDNEQIDLGEMSWLDIKIPKDCKVTEYNNDIYHAKAYKNMKELEEDINYDFLEWSQDYPLADNRILLNFKNEKLGYIAAIIDGTQYFGKDTDRPYRIIMYFSISPDAPLNETVLESGADPLSFIGTDYGLIQNKEAKQTYTIVEEYKSENLGVDVLIVEWKRHTSGDPVYLDSQPVYCGYFIYNNVEYQIDASSVNCIKNIIDSMK